MAEKPNCQWLLCVRKGSQGLIQMFSGNPWGAAKFVQCLLPQEGFLGLRLLLLNPLQGELQ